MRDKLCHFTLHRWVSILNLSTIICIRNIMQEMMWLSYRASYCPSSTPIEQLTRVIQNLESTYSHSTAIVITLIRHLSAIQKWKQQFGFIYNKLKPLITLIFYDCYWFLLIVFCTDHYWLSYALIRTLIYYFMCCWQCRWMLKLSKSWNIENIESRKHIKKCGLLKLSHAIIMLKLSNSFVLFHVVLHHFV